MDIFIYGLRVVRALAIFVIAVRYSCCIAIDDKNRVQTAKLADRPVAMNCDFDRSIDREQS